MGRDLDQLKRDLVTALQAERWAEALPLLEKFCARFPEHSKSWLNRGYCLIKLGRHAEAVAAFDRCLELEPGSEKAAGWRRLALAALEPPPGPEQAATATAAAAPALGELTRRAPARSEAPHSFGTMALPDARRGWQAGTVVDGRYEVREVARGGMAVVAIAFDRELRRMVAIKTPLPSVLGSADGRARFQREAESWIALGLHPNICCAYYLQEIGGMPRLFIEYVDGGDLNDWLKRDPRAALEDRLDLAIQIAGGLDYTHTFAWTDDHGAEHRGLVHRDIKPANVLLTSDGTARVTDFGLVRAHAAAAEGADDVRELLEPRVPDGGRPQDSVATGSWQTVTAAGGLVGTPPYMAPELWRQAQRGTVASDVYAYGCLLYELVCGRRPFVMAADSASRTREAHLGALMRMHLRDEPPDPRRLDPAVDEGLAAVMVACLAKRPDRRPASFAELRGTLLEAYHRVAGRAYPRPEPRRTRLLADSLNNRGASFVTLGLEERAAASFRQALAVEPGHLEAVFNSSVVEWRREGLTDAELERRLGEAEGSGGGSARAALLLARLRLLLDRPAEALEALDGAASPSSEALAARRARGLALLAAARSSPGPADPGPARELLRGVVEASPSDLAALIGLAEAAARSGDHEVADGALAAARSLDRDLPESLADAADARLPGHRLAWSAEHRAPVLCLHAAPGGKLLVRTGDAELVVWAGDDELPARRIELEGPARPGRSIAVADGLVLACSESGPVAVYDLDGDRKLRSFRPHPGVATCLALSPDGALAASGGSDRCLRIWNTESGECERTLQGHVAFVSGLAWHPTGPWIVTASADSTARVWNLEQGRSVHVLEGHHGPLRGVALAGGGELVLTAGQDGVVGVWELAGGSRLRTLRGHRGAVTAVAEHAGTVASAGEDGTVRLWRLDNGESLRVLRLASPIQDLAFTTEGRAIVAAHGSRVSRLAVPQPVASRLPLALAESAASGELAEREREFQELFGKARRLVEAGRMDEAVAPIRAARAVEGYELAGEALELWSTVLAYFPKRELRAVVELRRLARGASPGAACALAPDGSACFAGDEEGVLRRLLTATGDEVFAVPAHDGGLSSLAVSSDGELLASAGRDGAVRVWRAADGRRLFAFEADGGPVRAVVFTASDRAVIAAGDDGSVRLWRLDETARPELLGEGGDALTALALSADGRRLVGGGWGGVTVWDVRRRAELRRLDGGEGAVRAVAIGPDCRLMACGGDDGVVRLWELESGRPLRTLAGHEDAVQAVAFTPDARFLLSASKDAAIRVWDLRTGAAARVVKGHAGAVAGVAVARDGGAAVSAGADGGIRLWFLDWEPELPEHGLWDDRVRPFLEVFLRRREAASGGAPAWSERDLEELLADLGRRGFGWLGRERVGQELEQLARRRHERREEEQDRSREQARRRARQLQMAPLREILGGLGRNAGLKVAGAAGAVILVLALLAGLRTPGGAVGFSRLHRDLALEVQARGMRLERGTVHAYRQAPTGVIEDCGAEVFSDFVDVVVEAERFQPPGSDPGTGTDERFRVRYTNAVGCVGKLGDADLAGRILERARRGLHPHRFEDLLGVLVRTGAAGEPVVSSSLGHPSETVRHLAALTLVFGGGGGRTPRLLEALEGGDDREIEAASSVLYELLCNGAVDEDEAFETVRALAQSIDPAVRRNAVRALAVFEDEAPAREVLAAALEDSDPEVAAAAREVREILERAG